MTAHRTALALLVLFASLLTTTSLAAQTDQVRPKPVVDLGGPATVRVKGPNAFTYPARTLTSEERRQFMVGNALFKTNWLTAPASAAGRDGLGPFFDARSCSTCHFHDGRGRPPGSAEKGATGLLLRLGVPTAGSDAPHPIYGAQLQPRATHGTVPEGRFTITTTTIEGRFEDGTRYELERPQYHLADPGYGPFGERTRLGPRIATTMIGLGLLESIDTATILAMADPEDLDEDGISGRVHWLEGEDGRRVIGRLGWKATQPTVRAQTAAALQGDMGLTTSMSPRDNPTAAQLQHIDYLSGGEPEVSDRQLDRLTFYSQVLAVPARRDPEHPQGRRGEELFASIGCASCHVPTIMTGAQAVHPSFANREIHPFTDLLLHDLGPDLADEKRDGEAQPAEWRTPPLWGIGLTEAVNGHTRFLHDGRARNLEEAILWHGGEAQRSRDRYRSLKAADRAALLFFLNSL